jgi:hypothetical protein
LSENKSYGGQLWPDNGETDLMEHVGYEPTKMTSTVHTQTNDHMNNKQLTNAVDVNDATTQFKVYTCKCDTVFLC